MKKLLTLLLVSCVVFSLAAPVSADYFWYKDVDASDMVDELITYVKYNCSIEDWGWNLSKHAVEGWNETRTERAFDLRFTCRDDYWHWSTFIFTFPNTDPYHFSGVLHVDNPRDGMKTPYILTIMDHDRKLTVTGKNWWLKVTDINNTRFKR